MSRPFIRRHEIRYGCATVALFFAFLRAPEAQTEKREGIVGLLKLPHLFGEPCKVPPRLDVPLYANPETADVVGWIRAGRHDSSDDDCYRVVLNVHRPSDASVQELPVDEYEEEEPHAAIVMEVRGRWVKLRLADGAAWIEVRQYDDYLSLEQLLLHRQAYLTEAWDRTLAGSPSGERRRVPDDSRRHLIGNVKPVLEGLRLVLGPEQDPEEIRKRHGASSMRLWPGPNGTRIVYIERGTQVRAFERPDPHAQVVATFLTDESDRKLRSTGSPAEVAVFDRRPGWFQVALREEQWKDDRRVWIEDAPVWTFHPFAAEAEREDFENELFGRDKPNVRFIRSLTVEGMLWLYVEVMSDTIEESDERPTVVAAGWVPAHDTAGRLVVWFYSRD